MLDFVTVTQPSSSASFMASSASFAAAAKRSKLNNILLMVSFNLAIAAATSAKRPKLNNRVIFDVFYAHSYSLGGGVGPFAFITVNSLFCLQNKNILSGARSSKLWLLSNDES